MEEDTGRTLHLKDAAFIEDPQHNQVILKGKVMEKRSKRRYLQKNLR